MFKWRHFTLLSTKWANFKFDACYSSQKSWHGGNKGLKKQDILKIFSLENIWQLIKLIDQVCNMISYKRDILERQSLSEVKMGRGSPVCERVCKKILYYFVLRL